MATVCGKFGNLSSPAKRVLTCQGTLRQPGFTSRAQAPMLFCTRRGSGSAYVPSDSGSSVGHEHKWPTGSAGVCVEPLMRNSHPPPISPTRRLRRVASPACPKVQAHVLPCARHGGASSSAPSDSGSSMSHEHNWSTASVGVCVESLMENSVPTPGPTQRRFRGVVSPGLPQVKAPVLFGAKRGGASLSMLSDSESFMSHEQNWPTASVGRCVESPVGRSRPPPSNPAQRLRGVVQRLRGVVSPGYPQLQAPVLFDVKRGGASFSSDASSMSHKQNWPTTSIRVCVKPPRSSGVVSLQKDEIFTRSAPLLSAETEPLRPRRVYRDRPRSPCC